MYRDIKAFSQQFFTLCHVMPFDIIEFKKINFTAFAMLKMMKGQWKFQGQSKVLAFYT